MPSRSPGSAGVAALDPGCRLVRPEVAPVTGAALRALERAGARPAAIDRAAAELAAVDPTSHRAADPGP